MVRKKSALSYQVALDRDEQKVRATLWTDCVQQATVQHHKRERGVPAPAETIDMMNLTESAWFAHT